MELFCSKAEDFACVLDLRNNNSDKTQCDRDLLQSIDFDRTESERMTEEKRTVSEAVTTIVGHFASRETATVEDILRLATRLPLVLSGMEQAPLLPSHTEGGRFEGIGAIPAVSIEDSWDDDTVTCLCCGKSFTMLKRHLKAEHSLTEDAYRRMFGLPDEHPLTAPSYSVRKAEHARKIGLGKYAREENLARGTA